MNTEVMFSSRTGEWETPQRLFEQLDRTYSFTLDACATAENAKCAKYYTPEEDGLAQPWEGRVWCNPPYGREIGKWVKKAWESTRSGATVVMLLPARTDTKWFHRYLYGKAELRFLEGRIKFSGSRNSAPFPSMVAVFTPKVKP